MPWSGKGGINVYQDLVIPTRTPQEFKVYFVAPLPFFDSRQAAVTQHSLNAYPGSGERFQNTLAVNVHRATLATDVENPAHSEFLSVLG